MKVIDLGWTLKVYCNRNCIGCSTFSLVTAGLFYTLDSVALSSHAWLESYLRELVHLQCNVIINISVQVQRLSVSL